MANQHQRIIIPLPASLLEAVDDYRYLNRIASRADAVRQLIRRGLVNYAANALEETERMTQEGAQMLSKARGRIDRTKS